MTIPLNHSPNSIEEFKAWVGKRLPTDMTCMDAWPVVDDDRIIQEFIYPADMTSRDMIAYVYDPLLDAFVYWDGVRPTTHDDSYGFYTYQ